MKKAGLVFEGMSGSGKTELMKAADIDACKISEWTLQEVLTETTWDQSKFMYNDYNRVRLISELSANEFYIADRNHLSTCIILAALYDLNGYEIINSICQLLYANSPSFSLIKYDYVYFQSSFQRNYTLDYSNTKTPWLSPILRPRIVRLYKEFFAQASQFTNVLVFDSLSDISTRRTQLSNFIDGTFSI